MQKKLMAQAVSAVLGVAFAGAAQASGFQLAEQNASGLGNAYAGSAVVGENASTVYYNPAAMSKLSGNNISFGTNVLKPSYKFKDDGSRNSPATAGTNGGDAGGVFYLPNFYATSQINDKWYAGIGVNSPFGLRTSYEADWVGRFQSKVFDIKTYNVNPSVAYKANDKWSFGFGIDWQRMQAQYTRAAATLPYPGYQSTDVRLDVTSDAWGWNSGVTFKPSQTMDIGLSYRSRVIHHLHGDLYSSNSAVKANSSARVDMTLPDTYILSVSQQLNERWTMLGDISRTNWSTVDKVLIEDGSGNLVQVLNANFRDTWRIALGGTYKINDQWKWKYGVAYDQSPVRGVEERLVSLPDNNRFWVTTGAQWTVDEHSTLDAGLAYIYIPKDRTESNQTATYQGNVVGTYTGSIMILGVQYSVKF
jgi:long-chain fatty acid transport protein